MINYAHADDIGQLGSIHSLPRIVDNSFQIAQTKTEKSVVVFLSLVYTGFPSLL